ncbi:hypothetical protein FEF34_12040 [Streptomyces marianii]|uniref:Uncharacterized protein n=1 Tax=Streptomyces marianii TaxID=1817406 RepID=A0A5R9E4I1_9ACTN|nr:hypothetical protein FEF34_12040 [Streptomyces marianii]
MPATVFAHQRQLHQRPDRAVLTLHGVGPLEQRVRTSGQAGVELTPEARQFRERILPDCVMQQTHPHGLSCWACVFLLPRQARFARQGAASGARGLPRPSGPRGWGLPRPSRAEGKIARRRIDLVGGLLG